mmetsp:Transcript_49159/g.123575  ORF Transcript_49159/g.123575 Transcript_49159/m.123575 type:complete len:241 (+) Transcript_49159:1068-1790(+)
MVSPSSMASTPPRTFCRWSARPASRACAAASLSCRSCMAAWWCWVPATRPSTVPPQHCVAALRACWSASAARYRRSAPCPRRPTWPRTSAVSSFPTPARRRCCATRTVACVPSSSTRWTRTTRASTKWTKTSSCASRRTLSCAPLAVTCPRTLRCTRPWRRSSSTGGAPPTSTAIPCAVATHPGSSAAVTLPATAPLWRQLPTASTPAGTCTPTCSHSMASRFRALPSCQTTLRPSTWWT